jgi:hypothetical protein
VLVCFTVLLVSDEMARVSEFLLAFVAFETLLQPVDPVEVTTEVGLQPEGDAAGGALERRQAVQMNPSL